MNISEPIREQARRQPDVVAVVRIGGQSVTYVQLDRLIDALARRVLDLGLGPGQVAAVETRMPFPFLVMALALARIGVAAALEDLPDADADHRFTLEAPPRESTVPHTKMLLEWFEPIGPEAAVAPVPSHEDDAAICRIFSSSGTTGRPKQIAVSHELMRRRIEMKNFVSPLPAAPVQIISIWPTGGYGYRDSLRVLYAGGRVLFCTGVDDILKLIDVQRVNFLVVTPGALRHIVAARPVDARPCPSLVAIEVGGSHLPASVWRAARARLCPLVLASYGTTETGSVAAGRMDEIADRPAVVGRVHEGVTVEAVDAEGHPLPRGSEGRIRIRSHLCVDSYFRDPEGTAESFRDGWFYPGDIGSVSAEGDLSITGREGEIINVGGAKVSPLVIENALLALPGIKDAAAFGLPDADGIVEMWAAIVPAGRLDMKQVFVAIRERLLGLAPRYLFDLPEIPRNDGGKIRRDELVGIARARVAARKAGKPESSGPSPRIH